MKLNRWSPAVAIALAAATMAGSAQADYLWLERDATTSGTRARVGELRKPLATLPVLQEPRVLLSNGRSMPAQAQAQADHFAVPSDGVPGDLRFTATHFGDNGILTYYQARFGRQGTSGVNELELVPTEPNGNTFRLVYKGASVPASLVNVQTSEGWNRTLAAAKDGTVTLSTPFPGLYVLEVSARVDNGFVVRDGKRYSDVRHTATLSFEVGR